MSEHMGVTITIVQLPGTGRAAAWLTQRSGEPTERISSTQEYEFPVSDWVDDTMWLQMVLARLTDAVYRQCPPTPGRPS